MPEKPTRELLEALPPGSIIRTTSTNGSSLYPYTGIRIDADWAGASTDGWGLFGTKQWLDIAEWPDCEIEVIFNAGETDWPAMPPWASLVESIMGTPSIGGGLQVSSAGAEALADQIYRDNGLEELL